MTRLAAAIDIGTNSVLLTIAERRDGELLALVERAKITRLGEGVDRTRSLSDAAMQRTLACLTDYRRELDAHGVELLDVVGTSALRDAGGGGKMISAISDVLGVAPRVLSGNEEAELTFRGAAIGIDVGGELVVFDVGGGSTEIVVGSRDAISTATSLDVGSVRLFERCVTSDPLGAREIDAIDAELVRALSAVTRVPAQATLIGVAGTVTTLCALELRLADYDSAKVHGQRLARSSVERWADELASLSVAERRALPGLEPGRADVIVVGARIVRAVMDWAGATELVVSDRGVRWGLLSRRL